MVAKEEEEEEEDEEEQPRLRVVCVMPVRGAKVCEGLCRHRLCQIKS